MPAPIKLRPIHLQIKAPAPQELARRFCRLGPCPRQEHLSRQPYPWLDAQEHQEANQQKRQEAVRQQVEQFQQAMKWIQEHREEYLGQWVALEGDRLISHGTDALKVHADAKAAGIEAPFLEHIVEEKEPFWAGW